MKIGRVAQQPCTPPRFRCRISSRTRASPNTVLQSKEKLRCVHCARRVFVLVNRKRSGLSHFCVRPLSQLLPTFSPNFLARVLPLTSDVGSTVCSIYRTRRFAIRTRWSVACAHHLCCREFREFGEMEFDMNSCRHRFSCFLLFSKLVPRMSTVRLRTSGGRLGSIRMPCTPRGILSRRWLHAKRKAPPPPKRGPPRALLNFTKITSANFDLRAISCLWNARKFQSCEKHIETRGRRPAS